MGNRRRGRVEDQQAAVAAAGEPGAARSAREAARNRSRTRARRAMVAECRRRLPDSRHGCYAARLAGSARSGKDPGYVARHPPLTDRAAAGCGGTAAGRTEASQGARRRGAQPANVPAPRRRRERTTSFSPPSTAAPVRPGRCRVHAGEMFAHRLATHRPASPASARPSGSVIPGQHPRPVRR